MSIVIDIFSCILPYDKEKEVGNMAFDYPLLGQTVRELRKEKGLSQEVLSGLAGIARTHLTMIENGTVHPTLDTIWHITTALNVPPSVLFSRMEEKQQ